MNFSSSDEDDEDMLDLVYLANVQKYRRFWVHPLWLKKGKTGGTFDVMRELNTYPDRFQNFYRMSRECFYKVLVLVKDGLEKRSTNWREPICPEERLLITLRYFATGCSFKALSYYFLKGHSTVRMVVHHTAKVIWEKLQPKHMPIPTTEKWMEIADRFHSLWNLPNCIGSIDDAEDYILATLLNAVILPTSRFGVEKGDYKRKVAIKDAQESFTLRIPTINDFEVSVVDLRAKHYKKGLTLQPFIVAVGFNADQIMFFVYFDKCCQRHDSYFVMFFAWNIP